MVPGLLGVGRINIHVGACYLYQVSTFRTPSSSHPYTHCTWGENIMTNHLSLSQVKTERGREAPGERRSEEGGEELATAAVLTNAPCRERRTECPGFQLPPPEEILAEFCKVACGNFCKCSFLTLRRIHLKETKFAFNSKKLHEK